MHKYIFFVPKPYVINARNLDSFIYMSYENFGACTSRTKGTESIKEGEISAQTQQLK